MINIIENEFTLFNGPLGRPVFSPQQESSWGGWLVVKWYTFRRIVFQISFNNLFVSWSVKFSYPCQTCIGNHIFYCMKLFSLLKYKNRIPVTETSLTSEICTRKHLVAKLLVGIDFSFAAFWWCWAFTCSRILLVMLTNEFLLKPHHAEVYYQIHPNLLPILFFAVSHRTWIFLNLWARSCPSLAFFKLGSTSLETRWPRVKMRLHTRTEAHYLFKRKPIRCEMASHIFSHPFSFLREREMSH